MSAGAQPIPALAQIPGATHLAAPDWLGMPTDRFLLILERLARRPQPHGEWCFVALSLCLAFLIPLITTETFKALFGFKPEVWQALCLLGTSASGLLTLVLSVRWAYLKIKRPSQTAEQVVQEVVNQMEAERRRADARYAEAQRAAVASGHV
jgi:hypothetical protein